MTSGRMIHPAVQVGREGERREGNRRVEGDTFKESAASMGLKSQSENRRELGGELQSNCMTRDSHTSCKVH